MRYRMAAAGLCLALAACQTTGAERQTAGTFVGAGLGALIGSQIGSGTGQLVAVGAGTLLGALIGSEIGAYLDEQERQAMTQNTRTALSSPQSQQHIAWENPDTKRSYSVSTGAVERQAGTGRECRPFVQEVIEPDGSRTTTSGEACRQASGEWEIIG